MLLPTVYIFLSKYEREESNVLIYCGKYNNGRLALRLVNLEWEPLLTITVNLPDVPLAQDEIIVKTWAENEGVLEFLLKNNIVQHTGIMVPTGFVEAPVCKFLLWDQVKGL